MWESVVKDCDGTIGPILPRNIQVGVRGFGVEHSCTGVTPTGDAPQVRGSKHDFYTASIEFLPLSFNRTWMLPDVTRVINCRHIIG